MHVLQVDDPLDAIAVHAFNGTWGVIAVGFFAADNLIRQSYGYHPYKTNAVTGESDVPRHYGCFMGGDGRLLAAQIVYSIWLGGVLSTVLRLACRVATTCLSGWLSQSLNAAQGLHGDVVSSCCAVLLAALPARHKVCSSCSSRGYMLLSWQCCSLGTIDAGLCMLAIIPGPLAKYCGALQPGCW